MDSSGGMSGHTPGGASSVRRLGSLRPHLPGPAAAFPAESTIPNHPSRHRWMTPPVSGPGGRAPPGYQPLPPGFYGATPQPHQVAGWARSHSHVQGAGGPGGAAGTPAVGTPCQTLPGVPASRGWPGGVDRTPAWTSTNAVSASAAPEPPSGVRPAQGWKSGARQAGYSSGKSASGSKRKPECFPSSQLQPTTAKAQQRQSSPAMSVALPGLAGRVVDLRSVLRRYQEETRVVNKWRAAMMWRLDAEEEAAAEEAEMRARRHMELLVEVMTPPKETERGASASGRDDAKGTDSYARALKENDGDRSPSSDATRLWEGHETSAGKASDADFASFVGRLERATSREDVAACVRDFHAAFGEGSVPDECEPASGGQLDDALFRKVDANELEVWDVSPFDPAAEEPGSKRRRGDGGGDGKRGGSSGVTDEPPSGNVAPRFFSL